MTGVNWRYVNPLLARAPLDRLFSRLFSTASPRSSERVRRVVGRRREERRRDGRALATRATCRRSLAARMKVENGKVVAYRARFAFVQVSALTTATSVRRDVRARLLFARV